MNVDGAYRNDGCGGAGLIVRNEHGSVIGAWSKKLENMNSPLHADTETARLGLLTSLQQGWKNLEVECDCAVLVAALNRQSDVMVEVSRITEDCKVLMNSFENISIRHIYREANGAAHRLAHFASLDRIVELHLEAQSLISRSSRSPSPRRLALPALFSRPVRLLSQGWIVDGGGDDVVSDLPSERVGEESGVDGGLESRRGPRIQEIRELDEDDFISDDEEEIDDLSFDFESDSEGVQDGYGEEEFEA
ncbi:hypothetical protein ACLB2K_017629 [Fragaria x ananassa]